jgi:membrane protein implicated in regulation of membrane protease activity
MAAFGLPQIPASQWVLLLLALDAAIVAFLAFWFLATVLADACRRRSKDPGPMTKNERTTPGPEY